MTAVGLNPITVCTIGAINGFSFNNIYIHYMRKNKRKKTFLLFYRNFKSQNDTEDAYMCVCIACVDPMTATLFIVLIPK